MQKLPPSPFCNVQLFLSLVPELSPKLPGMAVLTTEETEFDKNLCVTDVAVTVKHGETKNLCMDIAGYAMFLETMLFFGNFVSVNLTLNLLYQINPMKSFVNDSLQSFVFFISNRSLAKRCIVVKAVTNFTSK